MTALRGFAGLGQPPHGGKSTNVHTLPPTGLSNTRHHPEVSHEPSALEKLPHLSSQVCFLWNQREFEIYVNRLIMDSRDGQRQGLPWDAAQELLFLLELSVAKRALVASEVTGVPFSQMFERCLATVPNPSGKADPWSDPIANTEVRHVERDRPRSKPAPVPARRAIKKESWWRRLFG